ncbi:MFS transporter [Tuberibacillus sp. Marseille-P3662]|uniref:MFS transporter n=1 Tax=Tuberibacillus sp. Marseille-P3662 TaxID=1965358 RepID=UPI00111C3CDB|nr:MFS transporter [Tuberibacillus sp. Marseille-P3662]
MSMTSVKRASGQFFYGWVIVMVSALGVFFSGPGQTYGISAFVGSFVEQFNGNDTLVSGIYSAATLLSGSLLFLMGRSVDRFGQRTIAIVAAALLGVACILSSLVANPVMLFIAFFMLRYFGQGSMMLVPNTLVPQWFIKKRGRAMSFLAIGTFVSSATFPPLNAWLINTYSAEHAWQILAVFIWIVFIPLAIFLIKNKPEDIGKLPDNAEQRPVSGDQNNISAAGDDEEDWTLQEARKTRAFWFILFCVSLPAMINTAITFHLFRIFEMHDLSAGTASLVLSLMATIGFPVTLVAGFVLERIAVNKVIGLSFIGQLVFLVLLLFMHSFLSAILFGVLWGIMNGFERITVNLIWPDYFGRKHLGSIRGMAQTFTVIGSAVGPLPLGFAFEQFNSFNGAIIAMMIFPFLGVLAAFSASKPNKADYFPEDSNRLST